MLCIIMAFIAAFCVLDGFSTIALLLLRGPQAVPSLLWGILLTVSVGTILPAITGIIVGFIGALRISSTRTFGRYGGRRLANVGMIINLVCFILAIINVIVEANIIFNQIAHSI